MRKLWSKLRFRSRHQVPNHPEGAARMQPRLRRCLLKDVACRDKKKHDTQRLPIRKTSQTRQITLQKESTRRGERPVQHRLFCISPRQQVPRERRLPKPPTYPEESNSYSRPYYFLSYFIWIVHRGLIRHRPVQSAGSHWLALAGADCADSRWLMLVRDGSL